jgi:hypothetical protein
MAVLFQTQSYGIVTADDIVVQEDGSLAVSGLGVDTMYFPAGTTYVYNKDFNEFVFTTPETDDGYVVLSNSIYYQYEKTDDGRVFVDAVGKGNVTAEQLISSTTNPDGTVTVNFGGYETRTYPAGSKCYYNEKIQKYVIIIAEEVQPEEQKEEVSEEKQKEEKDETPVIPELPKKIVVVHPTLAIHNVFRSNMFNVLNRIKPHQTVRSDKQYYVQSFKGTKTSHVETTTKELNTRVYIESTSLYSNIKNKETLHQTGGTVGFDYENIGFCFTDLTGELNQYDLDSRLYSVYAGFNDQHKVVLSYGDHDLGNFDGDSYGALYEFNYNNFVADVAYTNTKFDQENLKTYMVGVGYTVSGNVVGPVNGSIKGMVIQDFGDHKDQYGAKQGSTGVLINGMLQTNITNNLGVYLMASGELRQHATGATVALGLECSF